MVELLKSLDWQEIVSYTIGFAVGIITLTMIEKLIKRIKK